MQLLGDHQRLPNKQRTGAEKMFKKLNSVILAIQLACLLIDVSRVTVAADKTFTRDMWLPHDYELMPVLQSKTANCTYDHVGTVRGYANMPITIDATNQGYLLANLAADARWAMIVAGIALVLGAINKGLFDLNIYEFKYKQLVFHKELLTLAEFMVLCLTIQACAEVDASGSTLRDYLEHCDVQSASSLPFATPLIALYVGASVVLFIHVVTALIHLRNTLSDTQPGPAAV
jgi:hypothetical protein